MWDADTELISFYNILTFTEKTQTFPDALPTFSFTLIANHFVHSVSLLALIDAIF